MKNPCRIFCDGSAVLATVHPDQLGGSGCFIQYEDGKEVGLQKGWTHTKTGRSELHALIMGLKMVKNIPSKVEFIFDSQYVQLSVRDRIKTWKMRGWIGSQGVVKNKDLWVKIDEMLSQLKEVEFIYTWHKGHKTDYDDPLTYGNTVADMLADYKNQTSYTRDLK